MVKVSNDRLGFSNRLIKITNYKRKELHNGLPQLSWIMSSIGASGQGKTNSCIVMIEEGLKQKAFDSIFLYSPTATPNELGLVAEKKWNTLEKYGIPIYRYSDYNAATMTDCEKKIHDNMKRYIQYDHYKTLFEKFIRDPVSINEQEYALLESNEFNEPVNPNPSANELHPSSLVVLDDLAGSTHANKNLSNWVSRIRHNNASIITLNQYLKQVSPTIRKNCNCVMLFKNSDSKYLKELHQEFCSDITFEEFMEMIDLLTERHYFIFIDIRKDLNQKYRLNFDRQITF